ncbi:SAUR-like auxin-responsive protein family [Abeliophyllum distichum]|uniref:SAUR-like auxin-responsive protein family n=1 Tax=Abeliophyllum distichum TaxID=126358 RepID=A0ABD1RS12_9LAMI
MAIRMNRIIQSKKLHKRYSPTINRETSTGAEVPKGHFAVYVGEFEKKHFLILISFLNQPLFKEMLSQAEEEFGFDHPVGGLTIPCSKDIFTEISSRLSRI